ncbi:MAG: hypothetical protein ACRCXC_09525 [Legionella sp.]
MAISISSLFGQSLTALSLSSPTTLAGVAAAGGALAVIAAAAGVVAIHKKWEDYIQKEHEEIIKEINKIYEKRLKKVESPDGTFLDGFPPIFKFGADNKTVDSLHYNIDEINDIGTHPPHIEAVLSGYREDILDAIRGLKEYYIARVTENPKKEKDITAGVLSYLLNMLESKCLSFEGYDNDIAYLDALTRFIDDYASMKGSKKTQHFSRVGPIYSSLLDAKQKLERHQKSMPLRSLVDELREASIVNSDKLLRIFVKVVIPTDTAGLGDLVTYNHLKDGILRGEYIRSESGGKIVWSRDKEIDLPDCAFQSWIAGLARYYKQSLNSTAVIEDKNTFQPNELYNFSKWAQTVLEQQKQKKAIKDDEVKLKKALDLIRSVFKHSPNFINTQLGGTVEDPEFIPITNDSDVIQRVVYMADFAHLVHGVISLQSFCAHLIGSIDQLGSIYVNDPHHFNLIFTELEALCTLIKKDLEKNRQNFLAIAKANKNTMRLAKEGVFPDDVEKAMKAIDHMLANLGEKVTNYKTQHSESAEEAVKTAVRDMLSVARFFTKMYSLDVPQKVGTDTKTNQCSTSIPSPKTNQSKRDASTSKETFADKAIAMETALNELSNQISKQIATIKTEQPVDPKLAKYKTISTTLRSLQIKAMSMLNEKVQDNYRMDKANKTYNLVLSLYQTTQEFLALPLEERIKHSTAITEKIHAQLTSPENNAFIDKHRDAIPKFIYEHFGFFTTKTRDKLSELDLAYKGLTASPG